MTEIPADSVPLRDAAALVVAYLRGDREGIGTILDHCDLRSVAAHLMGMTAGSMISLAGNRELAAEACERRLRELSGAS